MTRGALACALCAALGACRGEAEAREREELGLISHRVDELRKAPNSAKRPALEQLRREPCSAVEACALQSQCVAAYERHLGATDAVARVAKEAPDGGASRAALTATLRNAERDLKESVGLTASCAEKQGELVRAHRL